MAEAAARTAIEPSLMSPTLAADEAEAFWKMPVPIVATATALPSLASAPAASAEIRICPVLAIVAVATIGGFMFGYDSGVINGTQKGLEAAFGLGRLGIGVNVGAILVGSAIGAFGAGRLADAHTPIT